MITDKKYTELFQKEAPKGESKSNPSWVGPPHQARAARKWSHIFFCQKATFFQLTKYIHI